MGIGHPQKLSKLGTITSLELNECGIKRMTETKSPGVIVDKGLSSKDQYKSVSSYTKIHNAGNKLTSLSNT